MADITMCDGANCEKRESCYRYKATPNEYWQSYFTATPSEDGKCDFYWKYELGRERNGRKDSDN